MGSFGSYYKGEKKKKKKGQDLSSINSAPVFVPPKIIDKGKKEF